MLSRGAKVKDKAPNADKNPPPEGGGGGKNDRTDICEGPIITFSRKSDGLRLEGAGCAGDLTRLTITRTDNTILLRYYFDRNNEYAIAEFYSPLDPKTPKIILRMPPLETEEVIPNEPDYIYNYLIRFLRAVIPPER